MVLISESKALFLGVPLNKRRNLTVAELTRFELDSGYYELRHGKTFITDEGRIQRGKSSRQLRQEAKLRGIDVETGKQLVQEEELTPEEQLSPEEPEFEGERELSGDEIDKLVQAKYPNMPVRRAGEGQQEWIRRFNEWRMRELGGLFDPRAEFRGVFSAENIGIALKAVAGGIIGSGILNVLAGTANIVGGGIQITSAGTAGGFASGLGIAGLSIREAVGKLAVKGAMGIAGFDGIMVWMASDNVLTGTAFTMKKLRDAVKAGILTRREMDKEIRIVQGWIDAATKLVEVSASLNPFIIPFRRILLINAEKSQKDFDLEVELIDIEFEKLKGGK